MVKPDLTHFVNAGRIRHLLCMLLFPGAMLLAEDRRISAQELRQHSDIASCWIQIETDVYDITDYLAEHKTKHKYDLERWCGKDATRGWHDKDGKNKPHTRKAGNLLKKYRIGQIDP